MIWYYIWYWCGIIARYIIYPKRIESNMILFICILWYNSLFLLNNIIYDTWIDSTMTNEEIIKVIKERKDILGINQEYLAELSELGIATLKRFESGKGNITLNNLRKIVNVLGLDINLEIKRSNKWDARKYIEMES